MERNRMPLAQSGHNDLTLDRAFCENSGGSSSRRGNEFLGTLIQPERGCIIDPGSRIASRNRYSAISQIPRDFEKMVSFGEQVRYPGEH